MDIAGLKSFIAVANCLNFTNAANMLYITQPTLSKQISNIENEVGFRLFDRNNRTVALTSEGKTLLCYANQVITSYEALLQAVDKVQKRVIGSLRVGYFEHLGFDILTRAVTSIRKRFPNVDVDFVQAEIPDLLNLLDRDEIDAALSNKLGITKSPSLSWRIISKNPLQCLVPETHRLASRKSIGIDELRDEKIIMPPLEHSPIVVNWLLKIFGEKKMTPNIVAYGHNPKNMILLALVGRGIPIMSSKIKDSESVPGIIFVDIEEGADLFDIIFMWKTQNNNPLIELFQQELAISDTLVL
jgi:DNA-binding transcriptional LysR family regulator